MTIDDVIFGVQEDLSELEQVEGINTYNEQWIVGVLQEWITRVRMASFDGHQPGIGASKGES